MKNTKLTLTIAIPAYNEDVNIAKLLTTIFRQTSNTYKLHQIEVHCDGSSDSTVEIVNELKKKFKKITLIYDAKRRGKIIRLNQIFQNFNQDILIVLDADIGLVSKSFIDNLIDPLLKDRSALMVCAHQVALKPKNFLGKIFYYSFKNWANICQMIPNFDSVHNFGGAATAYHKSFVKRLHIPENANEERIYLYLMAKKYNGFRYNINAKIVYWPVSSFRDFLGLSHRGFGESEDILNKTFGFRTIEITRVPLKYKFWGTLKSLLEHPFYAPTAIVLNLFIGKLRPKNKIINSSIWEFSESTKKPIII
jgi:cellulose synthase/poly-beta-1,6-N-acetylglucosamine synthase-like glycosyltransferase